MITLCTIRNMIPAYVTDVMLSNKRRYISRSPVFAVQDLKDPTYDAYEKDIGKKFNDKLRMVKINSYVHFLI